MGTKVEGKGYILGYFAMGDLNLNTNGAWSPPYYEEKRVNTNNFYESFMPKPTNGYTEYDKEMLRRTMLEHEATFRKQVYELHRLYRKQKDLMEKFEMQDLYNRSPKTTAETSRSNSFSSPVQSKGFWQIQQSHNNGAPLVNGGGSNNNNNNNNNNNERSNKKVLDFCSGLDLNEPITYIFGTDNCASTVSCANFVDLEQNLFVNSNRDEGTSSNNFYNGKNTNGVDFLNNTIKIPWLNNKNPSNDALSKSCIGPTNETTHSNSVFASSPCKRFKAPDLNNLNLNDLNLNEPLQETEEETTNQSKEQQIERISIDLNCPLPCTDDPNPRFEIDLEATLVCETDDESIQLAAAQDLVALSNSKDSVTNQFEDQTLVWFADVITSNRESSSSEESSDSFEALTLRLEEVRFDFDFDFDRLSQEKSKSTEVNVPMRAPPRRGRRQKKKDFRRDILPGLVSLSRNEVKEDLQVLGKMSTVKVKRVGRKPRNLGGVAEEPEDFVGPTEQVGPAADMASCDGVGVLGWGRMNRRCPRRRSFNDSDLVKN